MANSPKSNELATPRDQAAHTLPGLQRIADLVQQDPQRVYHSIHHLIDLDWLREAFRRTRTDGAPGIDGQTAADYAANLDANLLSLLQRFRSGSYQAPPVRRVRIPKGDGRSRPIGIPTIEDKILQRAVLMLLEPIYEQTFCDCSYGFRPGRSAHDALDALRRACMRGTGGWVIELDIESFFDTLSHPALRDLLDQRVTDGVLRRTIDKWLKAGVLEDGHWHRPAAGSPQGGVISPLLSNVYLHHVLDLWFERDVQPRMRGTAALVRYADDAVLVFANEHDARRVLEVLPKRFARFGLRLHPSKTRLIDFRKPSPTGRDRQAKHFDWLGFRHYWGRSQAGRWIVKRKTAPSRFTRSLRAIKDWLARHRHDPIAEQHAGLERRLRGHYGYFGIIGNSRALGRFCYEVGRHWRRSLARRNRERRLSWPAFNRLLRRYPLPSPRVVQRWPTPSPSPP